MQLLLTKKQSKLERHAIEAIATPTPRIGSQSCHADNGRCWCVALTQHFADLEPLCFSTRDLQNVQLEFCIVKRRHGQSLGTAIRGELKSTIGSSHRSQRRDFTVPPVNMTSFDCTGIVTFSISINLS